MNSKGSLEDILLIMGILFVLGLSILIGFRIATDTNAHIQADANIPANAKTVSTQFLSFYPGVIDNGFLWITFGLAIATMVMAALVRVHPIFIPIYFIGLVIVIIVSGILANVYETMADHATLSAQATQLTKVGFVLGKLPWFVAIFGIILMVVMYKTWKIEQ